MQYARRELASMSAPYEGLQQTGAVLKQSADQEALQSIIDDLNELEKLWIDVDQCVSERIERLESTVEVWNNVETGMENVLERLKETRSLLAKPLPAGYDDLEREIRQCQVERISESLMLCVA